MAPHLRSRKATRPAAQSLSVDPLTGFGTRQALLAELEGAVEKGSAADPARPLRARRLRRVRVALRKPRGPHADREARRQAGRRARLGRELLPAAPGRVRSARSDPDRRSRPRSSTPPWLRSASGPHPWRSARPGAPRCCPTRPETAGRGAEAGRQPARLERAAPPAPQPARRILRAARRLSGDETRCQASSSRAECFDAGRDQRARRV